MTSTVSNGQITLIYRTQDGECSVALLVPGEHRLDSVWISNKNRKDDRTIPCEARLLNYAVRRGEERSPSLPHERTKRPTRKMGMDEIRGTIKVWG